MNDGECNAATGGMLFDCLLSLMRGRVGEVDGHRQTMM